MCCERPDLRLTVALPGRENDPRSEQEVTHVPSDPDPMTSRAFVVFLSLIAIVLPILTVGITWAVIWDRRRQLRGRSLSRATLSRAGSTSRKELAEAFQALAVIEVAVAAGACLMFSLLAVGLCCVFVLGADATWGEIKDAAEGWAVGAYFSGMLLFGPPVLGLVESVARVGKALPAFAGPHVADTGQEWLKAAAIAIVLGAISGGIAYPAAWLCICLGNVKLAGLCGQIGAACDVPSLHGASAQAMRSWRICAAATALLYTLAVTLTARSGEWWFFPALVAPLLGVIGYATYHIVVVLRMAADALKEIVSTRPGRPGA